MNVLFFLNFFPGIGGVESISNNLIEYLGEEMNIYLISCAKANDMEVSDKLRKMYCLPHGSRKKKIDFYNNIIAEHNITHVIDQGIYPHISKIIFNKKRDRKVRLISVLHGVPGYEFTEVKEVIRLYRKNKGQKFKWKFYRFAGLEKLALKRRADKYLASYRKSYRRAAEMGDSIVLLTEAYRQKMIEIYGLEKHSDKIRIIPNALAAGWSAIREIPLEEKQNEIIYVGRLSAEKRVDKILEIWGNLGKTEGWRLSIVGDGPCRKELEELAAEKKLSGGGMLPRL